MRLAGLVAVGLALVVCGCSEPTGQVAGKVTRKGQPLVGAQIYFEASAAGQQYHGSTLAEGVYRLDYRGKPGLPPGPYKVTVKHYTQRNGKPLPEGEAGDAMKEDGRAVAHTAAFEKEVAAGANTIDLELEEGKKAGK